MQTGNTYRLPCDIDGDLDTWLEPFLDATGRKTRRKMAPLYVRGLLGCDLRVIGGHTTPTIRKVQCRECPVREPCPPKCCYPDMRRSNPTCEAPGTTATIWEHQSGGGPAEDGRLNASERPLSRSVIENRPKVLTGRSQKGMRVGSSIGTLDDGGTRTRRTIGRSRPIRFSTLDNRVSPTRPVAARRRYSDRKEGDGGGGRGCRRKRRLRCNGGDRAARAGIPSLKGRRLPAGLSGAMRLDASTDGDVRQRKLNRPKDGCRKPPVGRNQDRMLRAAGVLFPTAEA